MRRISAIFFLLLLCQNSQSFSPELCSKVCNFSSWLCWLCPEQQKENETNSIDLGDETLGRYLRPLTKAELNEKGQMAHAKFARQQKIVGGSPVSQGQSPWTVSIKHRSGRTFYTYCGGALISDRHVVTAAHCVFYHRPEELFVGVGDWNKDVEDHGEILSAVINKEIHPDYDSMTFEGDLAVLELAQKIVFDQYKQPAVLASKGMDYSGQKFNGTGWGSLRERGTPHSRLRRVEIPYVEKEACQEKYGFLNLTKVQIRDGMMCAGWPNGGADACQGDSGGPLVANLPGKFQMLKLSDLTERSDPQQGELERNVTRDVLENRLFWAVGESKEVQALALAALRTTLKQALTALQRYYEAYHARYHTQQVGKEEKPSKNLTHLGIPGYLAELIIPVDEIQTTHLSPLHPEIYRANSVPTLVGIVSWGLGCARADFPGVYTDIREYHDWISEKIGGEQIMSYVHED